MFSVIMMKNQNKKKVFLSIQHKTMTETNASVKMSHEYGISQDFTHRDYDLLSNFGNRGELYKIRKGFLNEDVENCLYTLFLQQQSVGNPLTNSSQQEKSMKICGGLLFGGRGSLRIFKKRYMTQSYRQKVNENKAAKIFVNNSTTNNSKAEREKKEGFIGEKQRKTEEENLEFEKELKKGRMMQERGRRCGMEEGQLIENSKLSFVERKRGDLNTLEQIIKKYANDDQTVITMGETIRRILENKI